MKYLSAVLALLVASTLILTPTSRAVAAPAVVAQDQDQAVCGGIFFDLHATLGGPGFWDIKVGNVAPDAWYLCHGTALGFGTYKGCSFCPGGTVYIFGPYFGPVDETFPATAAQMKGAWQVISATKTSGCKQIGL